MRGSLLERFEDKFIPEPNSGCWLWIGATLPHGYGSMGIAHAKARAAHRVSWELYRGPIPDGLHVLHKCDTPACVNPQHLFVGTNADNVADRKRKERSARNIGETNGKAVLSDELVASIRQDNRPGAFLARLYGVSEGTVHAARKNITWAHIKKATVKSVGNAGEYHGQAKLTADQVREIRARSDLGYRKLGRLYGVDRTTIRAIKIGKSWRENT